MSSTPLTPSQEPEYARVAHGKFDRGQPASAVLLDGFGVDVTSLLAVAEDIPES